MLVVGDSVGLDLGQALVADLANTGVVVPVLDGRVDTGLSRPDYFNWPAELQIDITNSHPNLIVVMIGANDPQPLVDSSGAVAYGTPAWTTDVRPPGPLLHRRGQRRWSPRAVGRDATHGQPAAQR